MYDNRSKELDRIVFTLDICLTILAFFLAIWLGTIFRNDKPINIFEHLFLVPLQLTFIVSFLSYSGAYNSPRDMTTGRYAWAIFRALGLAFGLLLGILFFLKIDYISRLVILAFALFEFICLFLIRLWSLTYFKKTTRDNTNALRLLIVGTGERAKEVVHDLLKQSEWGITIVGHLDPDPTRVGSDINGIPVIGTVETISACLKDHVIDEVIVAIPRSLLQDAEPIALACEEEGIKLRFMADLFRVQTARVTLTQVGHTPLLAMEPVAQDDAQLFIKRIIDLSLILLATPLFLPLMALTAIAIRLDSPGSVLFVQQRVGLRKHLFPMFKFRSMYHDAEDRLKEIEHLNEAEGPIFKITDDPRVTRVGKFIRRTSLDELPQLFNVISGDMSLVGPRPMSIRDVDLFDKGIQRKRFSVKPGLTCIWQISGRSNLPFTKWLELDLEYIEHWSLWLDMKILFKTIPAVLFSKGAV